MEEALRQFDQNLQTSSVGLVFFAGHAFQIYGKNYLAAVDTKIAEELSLKYSALDLDFILDVMKRAELLRRVSSYSTLAGTILLPGGSAQSLRTNWPRLCSEGNSRSILNFSRPNIVRWNWSQRTDYFGTIHGFKFPWPSDGYLGEFASG
jgi:hypothetical protein